MSTLKVNRIEPRTGDTVEIVGFVDDKYFHVYRNSDQVVENNVDTKVTFDSVSSDPYSAWSSSNNEYTIPSDGLYMVHTNIGFHDKWTPPSMGNANVDLCVNGSLITHGRNANNLGMQAGSESGVAFFTNNLTRIIPLNSGDKISWFARTSTSNPQSPSMLYITGNADYHNSFAWIYKVASL
jgi:hypothetical protein